MVLEQDTRLLQYNYYSIKKDRWVSWQILWILLCISSLFKGIKYIPSLFTLLNKDFNSYIFELIVFGDLRGLDSHSKRFIAHEIILLN